LVKAVPNFEERSGEVPLPSLRLGRFPCTYKRPAEERAFQINVFETFMPVSLDYSDSAGFAKLNSRSDKS
jgi:hypothetical protein